MNLTAFVSIGVARAAARTAGLGRAGAREMISVRQASAAFAALGIALAMATQVGAAPKTADTSRPPAAVPIPAPTPASSPERGFTAQEVAAVMQEHGYAAQIGVDAEGDPKIRSGAQGSSFTIFFYGCHKTPRCTSIEFSLGFHVEGGLTLEQMNRWNRLNRFGRAYLDDEKDPWLDMDVDVERGLSLDGIANNLETWDAVLSNFKHFLACAQKTTTDNCPAA